MRWYGAFFVACSSEAQGHVEAGALSFFGDCVDDRHARAGRSWTPARVALLQDPQHGLGGVLLVHSGVGKPAEGADDRDHRVGRSQVEPEAYPVL